MAVFFHPKQSGQYTVWVIERDKPPVTFFSTDTLPHIMGWPSCVNGREEVRLMFGRHASVLFLHRAMRNRRVCLQFTSDGDLEGP
ncbi:hypothetical protein ATANTOWER_006235 [Ataeniobius toweri]|uniref:Uncharacterized protein n=1 Tax=Ataeniobius toweri TaxID=208326 RepID=A0ABU7AFN4_9TELE|nr:hypothetical protein [Ataeniobius toweri]